MDIKVKAEILSAQDIQRIITRLAHEILEKNRGSENLVIVGIHTRGAHLASRISKKIAEIEHHEIPTGFLDITLYRDDFRTRLKQPAVEVTNIPFKIDEKNIVLVDDVLYTGRTIRSALDALMDFGRRLAFIWRCWSIGGIESCLFAPISWGKIFPLPLEKK